MLADTHYGVCVVALYETSTYAGQVYGSSVASGILKTFTSQFNSILDSKHSHVNVSQFQSFGEDTKIISQHAICAAVKYWSPATTDNADIFIAFMSPAFSVNSSSLNAHFFLSPDSHQSNQSRGVDEIGMMAALEALKTSSTNCCEYIYIDSYSNNIKYYH